MRPRRLGRRFHRKASAWAHFNGRDACSASATNPVANGTLSGVEPGLRCIAVQCGKELCAIAGICQQWMCLRLRACPLYKDLDVVRRRDIAEALDQHNVAPGNDARVPEAA